jgi:hypothetical protein
MANILYRSRYHRNEINWLTNLILPVLGIVIGRAIATAFADEGAEVQVVGRTVDHLDETVPPRHRGPTG